MNRRILLLGLVVFAAGALIGVGAVRLRSVSPEGALPLQPAVPGALPPGPAADREGIAFSATPREPPSPPDLLPAGVAVLYAFYNLPEAAARGLLSATWSVDGKSLGALARGDIEPDAGRPGHGAILLRAPKGRFVPGVYELELRTESRKFRASFVAAENAPAIIAQQAPKEAMLALPQHVVARGVGPKGEPVRPTNEVESNERVYYVLRYQGAEPGMAISVTWWAGQTEIKAARREVVLPSTSGWAHAWMQAESGLPAGAYQVSVTTAGDTQALARDQFAVR